MVQSINIRKILFLLPPAIIVGCILLTQSPIFINDPSQFSWAITFDLLITSPIVYFLIIRKSNIPKTTIVPVFILGIVVASSILPTEHQTHVTLVRTWFLPVLELGIVTYLVYSIVKAFKKIKQNRLETPDFFIAAKNAGDTILPKGISAALATELSVFYYGFIHWKKCGLKQNEYTYHKITSTRMVLGVFVFLIIIEAFAVHLVLQKWSPLAAWIMTILSIYGCFQVFGILRSLSKRPITITSDALNLKYGLMGNVEIPLHQIESVTIQTKSLDQKDGLIYLSSFKDMEGNNVLLEVKDEHYISRFYGFKKPFKKIALYVDEPNKFIENLNYEISLSTQSTP